VNTRYTRKKAQMQLPCTIAVSSAYFTSTQAQKVPFSKNNPEPHCLSMERRIRFGRAKSGPGAANVWSVPERGSFPTVSE